MEEPPEYVIFILATTEVHKIPATILSRCQRFDFKRIDPELIAERLMNISDKESIGLEKDAAALIAKLSDGGMRDALSLLDLCRSATDGSVTVENVADAAGLAGSGHLFELTEAFIKRAPAEAIEILGRLYASSADPSRVCEQLIGHFRNLMLMKNSSKAAEMIVCLPDELEQLRQLASRIEGGYIFYALSVLQETLERLARSSSRRTELEMAFVKLCSPEGGEGTDALIARISTLEQEVRRLKRMLEQGVVPAAAVQPAQQEQPAAEKKAPAERKAPAPAAKTEPEAPMEEMDETLWGHILNTLGKSNPALNAALLGSKAYIRGDLLLVDSKDDLFLQLMRTSDYAKESLREAVVAETGKKYRLGPYKKEKAPEKTASPLDSIAEAAKNAGIDIQIK